MSKGARTGLMLAVIIVVTVFLGTCAQRSNSRNALAKYKSGLRARGEKLSLADLGYTREPEPGGSFDALGTNVQRLASRYFQPGAMQLLRYSGAGEAQVSWRLFQPPFSSWGSGPTALTWEEFSDHFQTAADALEAIRQATRDPPRYFYCDPTNWANPPKRPFVEMRTAAQWLSGDAIAALRAGQLDRAQADLLSLTRLAQFNREDLTLVSQMIRVAIVGLGLAVTWEALQAEGWSEERLAALQKGWEAAELIDAAEKGMLGERAYGEAAFAHMRSVGATMASQSGSFGPPSGPKTWREYLDAWVVMPFWRMNSATDEMFFLKYHQRTLDALRKLRAGTPWPNVDRELNCNMLMVDDALNSLFGRVRYRFSVMAIPNIKRAASVAVRNETHRRLTGTAIAVEQYRLRHSRLPPDLNALVPEFLSSVTPDPMTGQSLHYRLNTNGGFVLYSAGEDGRDDGGDARSPTVTNQFDLWLGKDAVWPVPAQ